jgi:hypothetical protein
MRELKKVVIKDKIYLYPFPVMKDKKYLIAFSSHETAEKYLKAIENNPLIHPDESKDFLTPLAVHDDGQTIIYCPKGNSISDS